MSDAPNIDWNHNPQANTITLFAAILSGVGGLLTLVALFVDSGALWLTAAVVLLAVGLIGWLLLAGLNWWQRESRNQMLTVVAAITRDEINAE